MRFHPSLVEYRLAAPHRLKQGGRDVAVPWREPDFARNGPGTEVCGGERASAKAAGAPIQKARIFTNAEAQSKKARLLVTIKKNVVIWADCSSICCSLFQLFQ
jgi:hypothetical protein